jgi:predicted  nucleic acid-binding Zn-ribbon protein
VREDKQLQQTVRLADSGPDVIGYYLQAKQVSTKVKDALQKVIALRDRVDQTAAHRSRLEQRIKEITQEQGRIRENMARVAQNSELYGRYVRKLDQQETEIEGLRKEIGTLKNTEEKQKRELNDFLLSLNLD